MMRILRTRVITSTVDCVDGTGLVLNIVLTIRLMLRWTLTFLIIALVAAVFGFTGIAAGAAEIAKIIFYIFLVFFVISLIAGAFRRVE